MRERRPRRPVRATKDVRQREGVWLLRLAGLGTKCAEDGGCFGAWVFRSGPIQIQGDRIFWGHVLSLFITQAPPPRFPPLAPARPVGKENERDPVKGIDPGPPGSNRTEPMGGIGGGGRVGKEGSRQENKDESERKERWKGRWEPDGGVEEDIRAYGPYKRWFTTAFSKLADSMVAEGSVSGLGGKSFAFINVYDPEEPGRAMSMKWRMSITV